MLTKHYLAGQPGRPRVLAPDENRLQQWESFQRIDQAKLPSTCMPIYFGILGFYLTIMDWRLVNPVCHGCWQIPLNWNERWRHLGDYVTLCNPYGSHVCKSSPRRLWWLLPTKWHPFVIPKNSHSFEYSSSQKNENQLQHGTPFHDASSHLMIPIGQVPNHIISRLLRITKCSYDPAEPATPRARTGRFSYFWKVVCNIYAGILRQ